MAPSLVAILNDRQRHYLLAAYELDQAAEHEQRQAYLRDNYAARRPAAEWRWLPYGRWLHLPGQPPTLLRQALDKTLISPGTGSTWKALASRRLLTVENQLVQLPGMRAGESYYLPHVRLTTAGRRLARQLKGEVRAKKPTGLLSEITWQAFIKLWQRNPNEWGVDVARQLDIYQPVWQRIKWL